MSCLKVIQQTQVSFNHGQTYPTPQCSSHSSQSNIRQQYGRWARSPFTPSSETKWTTATPCLVPLPQNSAPVPRIPSPESHCWTPQERPQCDPPDLIDPAYTTAESAEKETTSQACQMTPIKNPHLEEKQRPKCVDSTQLGSSPVCSIKEQSEGGR